MVVADLTTGFRGNAAGFQMLSSSPVIALPNTGIISLSLSEVRRCHKSDRRDPVCIAWRTQGDSQRANSYEMHETETASHPELPGKMSLAHPGSSRRPSASTSSIRTSYRLSASHLPGTSQAEHDRITSRWFRMVVPRNLPDTLLLSPSSQAFPGVQSHHSSTEELLVTSVSCEKKTVKKKRH